MNEQAYKTIWKQEEEIAYIHGWNFSHLDGRYEQEDTPWSYREIVRQHLQKEMQILDYDTGGGEFLLRLGHPYENIAATEGYPPNVELCEKELAPLGIRFKACSDPSNIPFADASFDLILNRHGAFDPKELYRLLKPGGIFITQQVGSDNDRDLVDLVLPEVGKPYPHLRLSVQKQAFEDAGFEIVQSGEAYLPIRFFDVGAFVWFARVIPWEFPDFSVDRCFDRLLEVQKLIEKNGVLEGTAHRYMIVAKK